MLADSPTKYMQNQECTDFIAQIPTVYDEVIPVDGKLGEYVVVAKRNGGKWYLAAMTNWQPRDLTIDLSTIKTSNGKGISGKANILPMASMQIGKLPIINILINSYPQPISCRFIWHQAVAGQRLWNKVILLTYNRNRELMDEHGFPIYYVHFIVMEQCLISFIKLFITFSNLDIFMVLVHIEDALFLQLRNPFWV